MKLLYNGTLAPQTVDYVMSMLRQYPTVVEVQPENWQTFWDAFHAWSESALPKHTISIESGSTGEAYQTKRVLYGIVSKSDGGNGTFLFFKSQSEKLLFLTQFGSVVKSADPFRTVLED